MIAMNVPDKMVTYLETIKNGTEAEILKFLDSIGREFSQMISQVGAMVNRGALLISNPEVKGVFSVRDRWRRLALACNEALKNDLNVRGLLYDGQKANCLDWLEELRDYCEKLHIPR
jgi:hypothetical protein